MGLFGKKEAEVPGLVGVDLGAGGLKLVELVKEGNRARLKTYGYGIYTAARTAPIVDDPKMAGELLQKIVKEAGIKANKANAAIPSSSVFHAIITVPIPKDGTESLKPMIERQVQKFLTQPVSEMILDSTVIDKDKLPKASDKKKKAKQEEGDVPVMKPDNGHVRVLVSGASKLLVKKYVDTFKAAKLELVSLETEAFALIRSLVGNDKSRIMIVDIGYERTSITIVDQGFPFLHRSIKAAGGDVTNAIAQEMHLSLEEAEQMKLDLAIHGTADELPKVLRDAMEPILHEIKYSLELYAQQDFHESKTVDKIILTGGAAVLPQIDKIISEALDINVYLGDPWARVLNPQGLRPILEEIGPRFSVAVGLAMKGIEK